jgi:hypothetical protein
MKRTRDHFLGSDELFTVGIHNMKKAETFDRLVAFFIDLIIYLLLITVLGILKYRYYNWYTLVIIPILQVLSWSLYDIICNYFFNGTFGKLFVGVRINKDLIKEKFIAVVIKRQTTMLLLGVCLLLYKTYFVLKNFHAFSWLIEHRNFRIERYLIAYSSIDEFIVGFMVIIPIIYHLIEAINIRALGNQSVIDMISKIGVIKK